MDMNTFFKFPGILITIGAVLLLLSIILLIIAFKTGDEEQKTEIKEKKRVKKDELPIEAKKEDNKKEKIDDEGLDLTKVYEVSNNKEKEIELPKKVQPEVKEEPEVEENEQNKEDDVELL